MHAAHSTAKSWRKSRYCGTSACVEVAMEPASVFVRDGKNPDERFLTISNSEWGKFVHAIKSGRFDG